MTNPCGDNGSSPPDDGEPYVVGDTATLLQQAADHYNNHAYRATATICLRLIEANPDLGEAWYFLGRVAIETGDFKTAVEYLVRAVSLEPKNNAARGSLAYALESRGQIEQAITAWRTYRNLAPDDANAPFRLAALLAGEGKLDEAVDLYEEVVRLRPDDPAPLVELGRQYLRAQQGAIAVETLRRAVRVDETRFDSWYNLASALHGHGDPNGAIDAYESALDLDKENPDCHNALGVAFRERGEFAKAVHHGERAVILRPDIPEFLNNLGAALILNDRALDAVETLERALTLKPDDGEILNNLGVAYMGLGRLVESIACFEAVLSAQEDWADVHHNLGNAQRQANRLDDAEPHFKRALSIDPNNFQIHGSYAVALLTMNRPTDAIAAYRKAITLAPEEPELHKGLGIAQLMAGDMAEGWRNYEWRWRCTDFTVRDFGSKRWRGQRIENATLLIHAEQGFGDTLQFCRYIPLARKQSGAARVVVEVQRPMAPLLRCFEDGACTVIVRGDPIPTVGFDIPMLSLPGLFDAGLEDVPHETPYLRTTDALGRDWKARVDSASPSPTSRKIGFVWSGNPNRQDDALRSCPIEEIARLWDVPDCTIVSLQVDAGPGALARYPQIIDLGSHVTDFADTAALIQSLDLVITVDTAVAHLAGALGGPVWVLLGHAADWRYLLDRTDSPWYPSMRLFRQPSPGNWTAVMDDVRAALIASSDT
ncbi:MAG: tetratricopeptide repeat protein [Rhodospirillaceae bacterium]|nr:tetratricopeptide repeat protein [Rhodospirillaceae bacterium]